ncbi:MAG: hypothetical protein AB7H66_17745 [Hyphomonadaceae bacterium]
MRHWLLCLALLTASSLAEAQAPLPDTLRASPLTVAQQQELNRRLTRLQSRFQTLASETELRDIAIRNIAMEIFGARPDLDFDSYVELIESGARELRTYISEARNRVETDPGASEIRRQALAAAEAGQLSEARRLYDQLISNNRSARQRQREAEDNARRLQREAEDLADAADLAESARLAYAASDFRSAAGRYAEAAELAPANAASQRLEYRREQAQSLYVLGERFGDPGDLRASVAVYRDLVLPLTPRDSNAYAWGATQDSLGSALSVLGERGDDEALSQAVTAYRSALEVRTRTGDPFGWAQTQVNLATTLVRRTEMGDSAAAREAVAALRGALSVWTLEGSPERWTTTMSNLGAVLTSLGQMGDRAALAEAIEIYREVSAHSDRVSDPRGWGIVQINLGRALNERADTGDRQAADEAIAAFHRALEVFTPEVDPHFRSTALHNLANTLGHKADLGDADAAAQAVAILREALSFRTRERDEAGWAALQNDLGIALYRTAAAGDASARTQSIDAFQAALSVTLGRDARASARTQTNLATTLLLQDDAQSVAEAIATYRASLAATPRADNPLGWALAQMGLADALYAKGRQGDDSALTEAVAAYRAAQSVFTPQFDGTRWASAQFDLGRALRVLASRAQRGQAADLDTEAVRELNRAFEIYTREAWPESWAATNFQIGLALRHRADEEEAAVKVETLRASVSALQQARDVYQSRNDASDIAVTQENLGHSLYALGFAVDRDERRVALRDAAAAFDAAAQLRPRETEAASWARTLRNKGLALRQLAYDLDGAERLAALRAAREAYTATADTPSRSQSPVPWAESQQRLASIWSDLGQHYESEEPRALDHALAAYRGALEELTVSAAPDQRSSALNGLCYALSFVGERAREPAAAERALAEGAQACLEALSLRPRERDAVGWAATQDSLGRVREMEGRRRGDPALYRAALEHYQTALAVFVSESVEDLEAETRANIARVDAALAVQ